MGTENRDYNSNIITNKPSRMNTYWLLTIYEDIISNHLLILEAPLKGTKIRCPNLNAEFWLEVNKTSERVLSISCYRKFLSSRPSKDEDSYFLRLYFTITGIQMETVNTVMHSNEDSVTVIYTGNMFSNLQNEEYYVSTIKCVIRMVETRELEKGYLLDEEFQSYSKRFSKSQLKNMAYLIKRPKLKGVITGHEKELILLIKLSYIERSLPFSKTLARYIKGKEQSMPVLLDFNAGKILCEIHCGEKRSITEEESISLYLNSVRAGLHFLYVITSDYIKSCLNNDYVLYVLKAADSVNDRKLFKYAADFFLVNRSKILQSDKWKTLASLLPNSYHRSIIHNILLEQTMGGKFGFIYYDIFDILLSTVGCTIYYLLKCYNIGKYINVI